MIEVRNADSPQPSWTAPIPARVVFDESRTARLGTPLAGRVSAVYVAGGQPVKAGDPLFVVSSASLADLVANQQRARVERDTAQASLRRTQDAVDAQVLPGKELVAARQVLAGAELALRLAEQKLQSLAVRSTGGASFTVTATRDGVVVERGVAVGQTVSPDNGSLIAIADLSSVWVVADVSGSHLAAVEPGTNPAGALRPNALARVRFFEDHTGTLSVPADAVLTDGARSYVYVVKHGAVGRRDVIAGPRNARIVPIRSGLAAGDQIVARGAVLLENQLSLDDRAGSP